MKNLALLITLLVFQLLPTESSSNPIITNAIVSDSLSKQSKNFKVRKSLTIKKKKKLKRTINKIRKFKNKAYDKKLHNFAKISFLFSLSTIIPIIGILFGLASLGFGIAGISKIRKEKHKYRGIGLCIFSMALTLGILAFYAALFIWIISM